MIPCYYGKILSLSLTNVVFFFVIHSQTITVTQDGRLKASLKCFWFDII